MKKSLLIAVAALFVALGANAQTKYEAKPVKLMSVEKNIQLLPNFYKNEFTSTSSFSRTAKVKAPKPAGTIDGEYILNADNFDGDFTESTIFSIVSQTGTITLDQYEGSPAFEYNVVLNDFTYTGAVVYGYYHEDFGIIEIPVQTIFTHSTYKELVISAGARSGTENVRYGKALYLVDNGDGTMEVDPDYDETDPEDFETSGWVTFLPNYEGGGLWNYGFDIMCMQPNATMTYWANSPNLDSPNDGWGQVEKRVYVEDYGSEWVVSNFMGFRPVSVTLNGDGTCAIPYGIKMIDYDLEDPYECYMFVGVSDAGDGQHITMNYDKSALNGFYEDGYSMFFKVEYRDAEGDNPAGYYIVDSEDEYFPSSSIASYLDSENKLYRLGFVTEIEIETDEHAATGIMAPKATETAKSTTLYDLSGRVVDGSYKGIVISNGKKVVVK